MFPENALSEEPFSGQGTTFHTNGLNLTDVLYFQYAIIQTFCHLLIKIALALFFAKQKQNAILLLEQATYDLHFL